MAMHGNGGGVRGPAVFLATLGFALATCLAHAADGGAKDVGDAGRRTADFLHYVEVLSSDDFEGRSVGTHGGEVTEKYLEAEFRHIGLSPGNPDGSYLQAVPLTGHTSTPRATVHAGERSLALRFPEDFVAWSYERSAHLDVKASELVFAGYGVQAPEYQWDDFKGMDVRGKTLVVLINDPQIPDPRDPSRLDDSLFKGRAMTYYGRWTYKFEKAAELGAAAVLIVHETRTAAYPWQVVVNSNSGENFDIDYGGANPHFPRVPGWITTDKARELFALTGHDFDALKQAALQRGFRPVPLGATIDISLDKTFHNIPTHNVVGRLEGSDPKLRDEVVIYSAHWDHFGWNPSLPGRKTDQIFHGALDNATGVATLLEIAKAYRALPVPPRRSILFIATAAEERGLLGAQYYATHPLVPLRRTLADINMDEMNVFGRTRDIEVIGYGNSDLEDLVEKQAAAQGRTVVPDQMPENGHFFRADHFEFAKVGVPALYLGGGKDVIGRPAGYGVAAMRHFEEHDYHKVTDVVRPDWDLSGTLEDVDLLFRVGLDVAQGDAMPRWKPGSEFRARGEAR